jgi:hypothetical protein
MPTTATRTPIRFPLELRFKKIALSPQISVTDASGELVLYLKQKAFRLKEAVTVFADREQTRPLFTIAADRVIDISAQYDIADEAGHHLGALKRHGLRSLWKAHYEILRGGGSVLDIREENPWVKVMDGLVGEIPFLGLLTGYLFHPAYRITRADTGEAVMRLRKEPALFQSRFTLEALSPLEPVDTDLAVLGTLMMILLERDRG